MNLRSLFSGWPKKPALEAIAYFNGPLTKWTRSRHDWKFEEHPGGLRIPLVHVKHGLMPRPDEREIVDRKEFSSRLAAQTWVIWRLKGFDSTKLVGEVRPL